MPPICPEQDSPWQPITHFLSFSAMDLAGDSDSPIPQVSLQNGDGSCCVFAGSHSFEKVYDIYQRRIHMARPRKVLPPVKEKRISFRVTDALYETMTEDARIAGMSLSQYLRALISNRRVIVRPEIVYNDPRILKALGDIGRIGSNLNQIAHRLNIGETFSGSMQTQLQDLMVQLYQMRNEVAKMTGEYQGEC